jgi:hypothetical protein
MTETAIATLQELKQAPGAQPLALEGRTARINFSPEEVAQVGFVESISRAHDMLGGGNDYTLDANMGRAIRDAAALLTLAGKRPTSVERMDIALDVEAGFPSILARSDLGSLLVPANQSACSPRVSVDFPGALSRFDITPLCMKAVKVPGDPNSGELEHSQFHRLIEQAGWIGWPVALPLYAIAATRTPLQWDAGVGPHAMQRFERFGWANPQFGAPDVFWGLMPAGARAEDIACSVAEDTKACKAKRRIKPIGVSDIGGAFARVVNVGNRTVVLASRDRPAVEALTPVLTPGPVAALRGTASSGTLQRMLSDVGIKSDPVRYVADAVVSYKDITVSIRPSKAP